MTSQQETLNSANPLLSMQFEVPFHRMKPEHVEPAVRSAIDRAGQELTALLSAPTRTFENTVQALDDLAEGLARPMRLARHLLSVADSPELREAVRNVQGDYSAFESGLFVNDDLWRAVKQFSNTREAASLDPVRQRRVDHLLRDFRLQGADLSATGKRRVLEINVRLDALHTEFAQNVLDATNSYELMITDESALAGIPERGRRLARQAALAVGKDGWRFTLHEPYWRPFLMYAERRDLRREMHEAFVSRACHGRLDNRPLVDEILKLRQELANTVGFNDYADYRLASNMVKTGKEAHAFVRSLFEATKPHFDLEVARLGNFAESELGIYRLEPWDVAFVSEKLRQRELELDQEELRPYFQVDRVLDGLFEIARRLFGVKIRERDAASAWHPDVRMFDVHEGDLYLGSFYADLYPREAKRAGAWKNGFIIGGPRESGFEPHLAVIAANFTPPDESGSSLLTHDEVVTTFHEFGHLCHHLFSKVELRALGGTQVPRDFVELPSQIMENWAFEREALDLFALHADTGQKLPADVLDRIRRSRTFLEAYKQMRQLSFAKLDLELHTAYDASRHGDVVAFSQRAMEPFQIRPEFAHNHFVTAFTHVFTGSYAAGYYSYKWSEMLDADAFSRFAREGIFNADTGRAFLKSILERGDSVDPLMQFRDFVGRDPDPHALVRRNLGVWDGAEEGPRQGGVAT